MSLTCDPNLPSSERTFDRQFRTECIAPGGGPSDPYYMGTSTNDEYHPPGYINHDITFFKNFAIGTRSPAVPRRALQRVQQTQYQDVDTGAVFDYATGAQTDTNFGRVTGVRPNTNRIIQLGMQVQLLDRSNADSNRRGRSSERPLAVQRSRQSAVDSVGSHSRQSMRQSVIKKCS